MMTEDVNDAYVVLDALDECKTWSEVIPQLPRLKRRGMRLLLTSWTGEDIESALRRWIPTSIVVSIR